MYSTLVSTTIYVLVEGKSNTNRPRNYPSQNSKRAVTETLSNNIVGRGGKKPTTRERYNSVLVQKSRVYASTISKVTMTNELESKFVRAEEDMRE